MSPRRPARLAAAAAVLLAAAACGREGPAPAPARIAGRPAVEFLVEHDLFLAADEPAVVPGSEARFLEPGDEVFGVVVGGRARAYPVPMISYHHVVNDVIEGIPVAVTY